MAVVYVQFTLINVCMWISSGYMHVIQYYQQTHTSAILYIINASGKYPYFCMDAH